MRSKSRRKEEGPTCHALEWTVIYRLDQTPTAILCFLPSFLFCVFDPFHSIIFNPLVSVVRSLYQLHNCFLCCCCCCYFYCSTNLTASGDAGMALSALPLGASSSSSSCCCIRRIFHVRSLFKADT